MSSSEHNDRICPFCGARFIMTGTGMQHPSSSKAECFFDSVHIGSARIPAWDRGVEAVRAGGFQDKPELPFI